MEGRYKGALKGSSYGGQIAKSAEKCGYLPLCKRVPYKRYALQWAPLMLVWVIIW